MDRNEEPTPLEDEARELVRSFSDKLKAKDGARTELEEALERGVNDYSADDRRRRRVFQTSATGGW